MTIETWRPISGTDDGYEVSSMGRVRSIASRYRKGVVLKTSPNPKGYQRVGVTRHGRRGSAYVHILVAEAFHGSKSSPDLQVRHLNGDPSDNRPENLRWGTARENAQDMRLHGTHPESNKTHCPKGHPYDDVNTLRRDGSRQCIACRTEFFRARRACEECGVEIAYGSRYRHMRKYHPEMAPGKPGRPSTKGAKP